MGGERVPPQHVVEQAGAAQPQWERALHKDGAFRAVPGQQLLLFCALDACKGTQG